MDFFLSLILKWQNKVPNSVRWLLSIPISALIIIILLLPIQLLIFFGIAGGLILTIRSIFVHIGFLILLFNLIPNKQILFFWIFTALRSIALIIFLFGFIFSIFNPDLDFTYYRELVTEILILLSSLYLIYLYKNSEITEKDGLIILKYLFGISIFVTLATLLDRALISLSDVPYIGWFFRIIKGLRDNVMG